MPILQCEHFVYFFFPVRLLGLGEFLFPMVALKSSIISLKCFWFCSCSCWQAWQWSFLKPQMIKLFGFLVCHAVCNSFPNGLGSWFVLLVMLSILYLHEHVEVCECSICSRFPFPFTEQRIELSWQFECRQCIGKFNVGFHACPTFNRGCKGKYYCKEKNCMCIAHYSFYSNFPIPHFWWTSLVPFFSITRKNKLLIPPKSQHLILKCGLLL